jgi:5-methylcytosine-specific restriction endonuclease McrA
MNARRRSFGKAHRTSPKGRHYGSRHEELAKVVVKDAICAYAYLGGCKGPLEADHIVPWVHGGESTLENMRPMCRRHNRKRGGQTRRTRRVF